MRSAGVSAMGGDLIGKEDARWKSGQRNALESPRWRTLPAYGVDDQSGGEEVPEPPGSWNGHNLVRKEKSE